MTLIEVDPPRHLAKSSLPTATLRHCPIGATIRLTSDLRPRTILAIDRHYAYFTGDDKASLCCPVEESAMAFGDGAGWRIASIPKE